MLEVELPRGEILFKQMNSRDRTWGPTVRILTNLYLELNALLGQACKKLEYPTKQWEWKDSAPLEALAKEVEGLATTEWYQRHLSMMLNPIDHPWTEILT